MEIGWAADFWPPWPGCASASPTTNVILQFSRAKTDTRVTDGIKRTTTQISTAVRKADRAMPTTRWRSDGPPISGHRGQAAERHPRHECNRRLLGLDMLEIVIKKLIFFYVSLVGPKKQSVQYNVLHYCYSSTNVFIPNLKIIVNCGLSIVQSLGRKTVEHPFCFLY